jgi:hypothetical protein
MANDPTARRAEKSAAASAMTHTITINDTEPVRISRTTAEKIMSLLDIQYSPIQGTFFATLKEENGPAATGPLGDTDGDSDV